jgi:hypothetical protein
MLPKAKTKRVYAESNLQDACVKWFRLQYKDFFIRHIKNEGIRTGQQIRRDKNAGFVKGWPDIEITGQYPNMLFVELKAGKNKLSEEQKEVHAKLKELGWDVVVAYTIEEFIAHVQFFMQKNSG